MKFWKRSIWPGYPLFLLFLVFVAAVSLVATGRYLTLEDEVKIESKEHTDGQDFGKSLSSRTLPNVTKVAELDLQFDYEPGPASNPVEQLFLASGKTDVNSRVIITIKDQKELNVRVGSYSFSSGFESAFGKHKVRLEYSKRKIFSVWVDGILRDLTPITVSLSSLSRVHFGKVTAVDFNYRIYNRNTKIEIFLVWLSILSFLSICGLFYIKSATYLLKTASVEQVTLYSLGCASVFILVLFALNQWTTYYLGLYWQLEYPWNTVLFRPIEAFGDFFKQFESSTLADPYSGSLRVVYGPFGILLLRLAGQILSAPLAFLALSFSFICCIYLSIKKASCFDGREDSLLRKILPLIFCICSYPILFCIDRGNLEMLLWIVLLLFLNNYQNGRKRKWIIYLSLAASIKVPALIFGLIPLGDKKFRSLGLVALATLGFYLLGFLGLAFFGGASMGLLLESFLKAHSHYADFYFHPLAPAFNHSVWAWLSGLKLAFNIDTGFLDVETIANRLSGYLALMAILLVLLKRSSFSSRLILTITTSLLIMPLSFDYRLCMIFFGIAVLSQEGISSAFRIKAFCLLIMLDIPLFSYPLSSEVTIGILIRPLVLFALWGVAAKEVIDEGPELLHFY